VRVAVVGAGWIGREHVVTWPRLGADVVAVCDVELRAAEVAAQSVGATAYESLDELLDREQLDAVVVCVPPLAHRDAALAVLERRLALYLEKPIARTAKDAAAIVSAAAGRVCAIGYQWHALDLLDDVRQELDGQRVGLLAGRSIGPTQSRPWFLDRAQGGGNLLERASHHVDLQRAIAGEVVAAQAAAGGVLLGQAEGEPGDIEDAAVLTLRFADGGVGSITIGWTRAGTPGIYALDVVAEEATLSLALDPDFRLGGVSRGRQVQATALQHPFERSIARFLDAARAGDPSLVACTPADAARTLAVAVACERALATGELVQIG